MVGAPVGAYAVTVGTEVPGLADEAKPVDPVGHLTQSVEALVRSSRFKPNPTTGGPLPPTAKEARR